MKCKGCGNCDEKLFSYVNGKKICRVCLEYQYPILENQKHVRWGTINLAYQLTDDQKRISSKILELIKMGENVLVNAVCGAGKTEIIYESIIWALKNKKRVGIAIPRKDVVEELYQRMRKDLGNISITRVYGGKTVELKADVIIFTTHQAYRYIGCFDLLFVDEVDAFPFYKNKVLESILKNCCEGSVVYMSATISNIKDCVSLYLNKRYHNYPIPVPKVIITFFPKKILLNLLSNLDSSLVIIIYVSSINEGEKLYSFLQSKYEDKITFIHSKIKNRDVILEQIRNYRFKVIISTTILERGITLKDAQVIVFGANNRVFDVSTLIQIAGRAGRKADYPDGKVYFISNSRCIKFKKVIKIIQNANK